MSNRIYIVLHKKHPTVLRRALSDKAVPSHWFKSPLQAWQAYTSDCSTPPDPTDFMIVGGDAEDTADSHGAHVIWLDWTDTSEVFALVEAAVTP